jgi:plastocyanin
MVFAVNCGSDGSPNSFTNFKQAALAFGAAQSSAAAAATAAPSAPAANGGDSSWTTAPSSISSTPDPTPTAAEAAIQTVKVGGPDIFSFNPSNITANVGDVIVFEL